ncbi:MAG TPA: polysaccharide deacetylase family protein [Candidatus Syntrophosphaera sp.]|nr:polysaccharide deacetylase family protein [Candidatus Cloacimonadota bacterium]HOR02699.1 polysaccharide deacetylase family protein [Candidatus Syntrophosphaera sp.]
MLKVALTHDVDRVQKTHQYLTRSLKRLKRGQIGHVFRELCSYGKRKDVYWNFPDIMETEAELGVRSTFFFLQESYPFHLLKPAEWKLAFGRYDVCSRNVSRIIRDLDQCGWEIGLHGSYRSFDDPNLLKQEKDILEQVLGKPVIGIRQHYLNLADQTWRYQEEAGFKYDTSLGYTDRIGFREGRIKPFFPTGSQFCVFPLAIMDSCYAEDGRREQLLEQIISQTKENDAILVLNWHSNSWNAGEYPGYKEFYINIVCRLIDAGAEFKTLVEFWKELAHGKYKSSECSIDG